MELSEAKMTSGALVGILDTKNNSLIKQQKGFHIRTQNIKNKKVDNKNKMYFVF